MAEVSDHQEDTNKGKEKESNQDEDGIQDDTESAADTETEDDEEDDDEEDEPKLKYARMTGQLGAVYRNGDAMSAFLVAGNKMLIGTHNGNTHVLSLPSFESLRVYTAHSASVTSISISPFPPPLPSPLPAAVSRIASQAQPAKRAPSITSDATTKVPRTPKVPTIPNIPSNAIYIATSSMDGKVCIVSLVDMKDVQIRNFARPVQAVSLSPDYKNDRTYVSGGLAGNLVLTVGGKSGTSSTSTTVGTASATASGWLGSIGLGGNAGQDTVLHSGEGTISTIKWSLTGKYVVWVNEHGVRIMRSHLHLENTDSGSAWKRIGHVGRPQDNGWEEMAGVWKARVEWIDEAALETDEDDKARETVVSTPATMRLKQQVSKSSSRIEKLVIGWGGTVWIINVHPEGPGVGTRERSVGRAEIIKILRMDCIISGLSLYTPTLLLVLAYMQPDKDVEEDGEETEQKNNAKASSGKGHKSQLSTASTGSEPRGGIRRRANALSPELRLIDLRSSEEIDTDQLTVSRFERLSSSDYHLGVLPAANNLPMARTPRGTLETLTGMGSSLWSATINATSLLSSSASVHSAGSNSEKGSSRAHGSASGQGLGSTSRNPVHPDLAAPGMKIFIHSPYDCILATKRDLSDHLSFLLEHHKYQQAWELIDESPEVISTSPQKLVEIGPASTDQARDMKDDFYDDITSTADSAARLINSSVEKEKRRIGELWIQQLVQQGDWVTAGSVCGKVLGTSTQWKEWVYRFAAAKKFDEIVNFIPSTQVQPPLDSTIYEVVLGYYITYDRLRVRELLEHWSPDLFNIKSVTTILENQLKYRDVREDSIEFGEAGRDWRVIVESLAKLYVADGRPREALKHYVKLRDADMAMSLIKDYHLVDAVAEDIPGFILLRVTDEQKSTAPIEELSEATSEAINLLVLEAQHGLIQPSVVVNQLKEKLPLYLFFYLRSLWRGDAIQEQNLETHDRLVAESKALVDAFADLAVHLFALYDRNLLMEFLKSSTYYTFEKATAECEDSDFVPELVYLYSKTGQTKRALYLIIDRLADVSQAISFAKEQDDTDLWEDLLDYSMDKPRFIRGLLEEVGTAIDPITLVRRIPEGLAIEGLRDGLSRMIKEYELQHSISYGVAKVLRSEVRLVQNTLRSGQRKGVKFDVAGQAEEDHEDVKVPDSLLDTDAPAAMVPHEVDNTRKAPRAGHCVGCHEPFTEHEAETLVGFACGHVFHLSHLLSFIHDDRPVTPPDPEFDENREITMTYSIGAKVTHARLLKDRIKDGCPLCITKTKV